MNPQIKQNNQSETNVLNLEILNTKYNNLLIQYKQSVADYINYLNKNSTTKPSSLVHIKGQAFWGAGTAGNQSAYTKIPNANMCAALCLKTSKCTGATFNPSSGGQSMCWLRSGDGNPVPSKPSDIAIVPHDKQLLLNIKSINTELTKTNNKIMNIINNSKSLYNNQSKERSRKSSQLLDNYNKLNTERVKIDNMINEYQDLDQLQNEGNLKASANYYSFLLLFILTIFISSILYKISSSQGSTVTSAPYDGDLGINIYYILFIIILLAIFIYYYSYMIYFVSDTISYIIGYLSNYF